MIIGSFIDAQFGGLARLLWNSEIEFPEFWRKERRACAFRSRYALQPRVRVGRLLLDNVNETLAARNVNSLQLRVVEQIVGIAGDAEITDDVAVAGIENCEARRLAAADEQTAVRLVKCHGEIGMELFHRPFGDQLARFAIYNSDFLCVGQIYEDPLSVAFQLE